MALQCSKAVVLILCFTVTFCCQSGLCFSEVASKFWEGEIPVKIPECLKFCSVESHFNGRANINCGTSIPFLGHVYLGVDVGRGGINPHADIMINTGVVNGYVKGHFDRNGVNVVTGGKVSVLLELEGEVGIIDGALTGKAAGGVGFGELGGVSVYINGNTKGKVSVGVKGNANLGLVDASANINVDQDRLVRASVRGGVNIGHIGSVHGSISGDSNGNVVARVDGNVNYEGRTLHGGVSIDNSGTVSVDSVRIGQPKNPKIDF